MDSLLPIIIVAFLIIINGLFVAAEFAIVGAPRTSINRLAMQGNLAAKKVQEILNNPQKQDRYIATAQLGITFASLGLGMYGEHMLAHWLAHQLEGFGASKWIAAHTLASILAISILTYFHIVLGEMVPKSLALQYAEKTVLKVTPIMLGIKTALFPLVVLLNGIGNGILKLMGIQRQISSGHYHTPEELRYIVEESAECGHLCDDSETVLQELFKFGELVASDVMVPRVHILGIPLKASKEQIKDILHKSRHTCYPVYDNDMDHIMGMLQVKDILKFIINGQTFIKDIIRKVPFVPESAELETILKIMRRESVQMVIVMDEHGGTAGIITIDDIFEEVVGQVNEEYTEPMPVYNDELGNTHVAGTVRLGEVGELFDVDLEYEEVDTVSGLVLALLERPALVGDIVNYEFFTFEVVTIEGNGVSECIVTYQPIEKEQQ